MERTPTRKSPRLTPVNTNQVVSNSSLPAGTGCVTTSVPSSVKSVTTSAAQKPASLNSSQPSTSARGTATLEAESASANILPAVPSFLPSSVPSSMPTAMPICMPIVAPTETSNNFKMADQSVTSMSSAVTTLSYTPNPSVPSVQEQVTFAPIVSGASFELLQRQINSLQQQLLESQMELRAVSLNNATSSLGQPTQFSGPSSASISTSAASPCIRSLMPEQTMPHHNSPMPVHNKLYDLPEFSGAAEDWPMFATTFQQPTEVYKYSDFENCLRLQKALKGTARECVKSLLIHSENVKTALEQLKLQFGRPETLIRCQIQQVKKILPINEHEIERLLPFAVQVQNLAAFLENAGAHQHLANPTLMEELVRKLPISKRLDWVKYSINIQPYATVLDFNIWIKGIADLVRMLENTGGQSQEVKRRTVLHTNSGEEVQATECPVCLSKHKIWYCKKFLDYTIPNRWIEVKKHKLCFCCLVAGHSSRFCRRRQTCQVECTKKHNKLLHERKDNSARTNVEMVQSKDTNNNESVLSCSSDKERSVLLFRVVPVILYGLNTKIETYALLDEGSSVTMVDSALLRELGVHGHQSKLNLNWYAGNGSQENATVVNLCVSGVGKHRKYNMKNVYGVSNLKLPSQSLNMDISRHPNLPIKLYSNAVPRVLIGLDHCHLGLPDEILPLTDDGPYAANTPLGWVVFGRMPGVTSSSNLCLLSIQAEKNIHDLVASYFDSENFGISNLPVIESSDDVRSRQLLQNIVKKDKRYQCRLLWKSDNVTLPKSFPMALNRLMGIERKMKKNAEFAVAYKNVIQNYINKDYVRKLSQNEIVAETPRTWYLPHFGVENVNKPGKIRLVFDAAATVEDASLNTHLLKGPQEYKPLPTILFNFRVGLIGVCGDIKEMFHQILVTPEDRGSQRFLWRDDPRKQPDVYEMNVMTFGAACSPCIAHHVKVTNALQFQGKYPRAVKSIVDHHYVDDFVDCFESPEKAIEITNQVRKIHEYAGFELCNFSSNSLQVVLALKGSADKPVLFNDSELGTKVLGMFWHPYDDTFRYSLKFPKVKTDVIEGKRNPTKRELLSVVMSIFDPLGFLSHFVITAKLLLREVWKHDIRWDEPLPHELNEIWKLWRADLKNVVNVSVPRYYFKNMLPETLELHMFVDASQDAFGAIAYWRSIGSDGRIDVSLIASKTKCAPTKIVSIPRLELQAAVLGTRLLCTILKDHSSLTVNRRVCWSDSTTVINWIGSESRRYKPFVAHRISEILDSTNVSEWKWIPTEFNVADEATRMKNTAEFEKTSRWFRGPNLLYSSESEWPNYVSSGKSFLTEEELRPKYNLLVYGLSIIEYKRFSSYLKLKRTIAWVLRFIKHCKKEEIPDGKHGLTAIEIKNAESVLFRLSQAESFASEIDIVKSGSSLSKSSDLYSLSPYVDEEDLLRVYGRIDAASWLPVVSRHPIILSSIHPLSLLIVSYVHRQMKHYNFEATMGEIRSRFWIPRLRKLLSKSIANCTFCKVRRAMPSPPFMGSLPSDRLTPYVRPFSYTGLDYFGPVNICIGRRREKRWVALFTCLTVRAIHLEVAFDLSTDACILAIRNFINRRGTPARIRSDNGKNFVGADQVAKQFDEVFDVVQLQDELSNKGIDWRFNCPHDPSAGGAWERMVQCVKKVLRVTLKEVAPKEHTFQSLLIEAENIVNSRPLTHLPVSSQDEEPLTPNHFLLGCPNTAQTPSGIDIGKPAVLRKQWRISRQLRDHFWKRWIVEYLPTLTRRSKWCERTEAIAPGDLVLICDPGVSRREWQRGVVDAVCAGSDGVVRRAVVRTKTGVLKRPVSKLAVLDLLVNHD